MRIHSAIRIASAAGAVKELRPLRGRSLTLAILDCPPRFGWESFMDKLSLVPFQGQHSTLFQLVRGLKMGYTSVVRVAKQSVVALRRNYDAYSDE